MDKKLILSSLCEMERKFPLSPFLIFHNFQEMIINLKIEIIVNWKTYKEKSSSLSLSPSIGWQKLNGRSIPNIELMEKFLFFLMALSQKLFNKCFQIYTFCLDIDVLSYIYSILTRDFWYRLLYKYFKQRLSISSRSKRSNLFLFTFRQVKNSSYHSKSYKFRYSRNTNRLQ